MQADAKEPGIARLFLFFRFPVDPTQRAVRSPDSRGVAA